MKLEIELVPAKTWKINLRKVLSKKEWRDIRDKTSAEYGQRCGICGYDQGLTCHEIWEYDDVNHRQTLKGFITLCGRCHHVKHIGNAGKLAQEGKLDYNIIVEHFMKINECDLTTFETHSKGAFTQWEERSKYEWIVDLGKYNERVSSQIEPQDDEEVISNIIEEAEKANNKELEINPQNEKAWLIKGEYLEMLSQAEEAGKCYNMVLELNPKNDTAWWHKARVLYDLGRVEEANRCTEKALEINPHIPKDFHYHGARAKR